MKKAFAILLSVLLLFSALPFTALGAGETCDCGMAPRIYINGINCARLIRDAGTENEKTAFSLDADAIIGLVKDNKDALIDMLDGRFSEESETQIADAIIAMFDDCSMDPNGDSKYAITTDYRYTTDKNRHKSGENYNFSYDWRLDPYEIADQLHDYIEFVKNLTGHDSVHLVAHSLGTIVMDTYLTVYGYEGLESCVWYCGAYRGVDLVGQLFAGGLHLDPTAVTEFLHENTENSTAFNVVSALVQGLTDIGITGGLFRVVNKIADRLVSGGAFSRVLRETFGGMPALWSFVDEEYYEDAKNFVFPTAADKETYATLIERIDRYHNDVQAHVDEIMENARAAAGKIGVVVKYNRHATPVVPKGDISADSIIDVYNTSGGATAAKLGETLGDDYKQAVNDGHNHLSADGMVDASTCRYPEYTWFIRDMEHSANSDYTRALFDFICFSDHQVDVFENPEFPQFSLFNRTTGETQPLTEASLSKADMKFVQKIHQFFARILAFFRKLFTGKLIKQ